MLLGRIGFSFDGTHVEAPSQGRAKQGASPEAILTSRSGPTSKVHVLVDPQGWLVAFALTSGDVSDLITAIALLEGMPRPKRLIAEKAWRPP